MSAQNFANKVYWLYIIYSAVAQQHYIGISSEPDKRLRSHRRGACRATCHATDWETVARRRIGPYHNAAKIETYCKRRRIYSAERLAAIDTDAITACMPDNPFQAATRALEKKQA